MLARLLGCGTAALAATVLSIGTAHADSVVSYYDDLGDCAAYQAIDGFDYPDGTYECHSNGATVALTVTPKPPIPPSGSSAGGYPTPYEVSITLTAPDAADECLNAKLEFDLHTDFHYMSECEPADAAGSQYNFTATRNTDE